MRNTLIASSLLSLSLFAGACQTTGSSSSSSSSASGKETAATVNGTNITVEEVDRITAQQAGGQKNQLSPLELASARLQVLEELIQQEVLYQRAQKDGITPTDEEITQLIQKRKQEAGITEEDFEKQLKQNNQTQDSLRADIRKQLAIQKLQDKLSASLKVQDREVTEFFNSNPQQFIAEPGVGLSDIIVDPSDNQMKNDVKGEAAAAQKINEIRQRLNSGTDFATAARVNSEAESAMRAGDLGFIPASQFNVFAQNGLPNEIGAKLMTMNEGDLLGPIRDQRGRWHIFKLTQKRTEKRQLTLDDPEVRKQISDYILSQRSSLLNAALLTRARDEAKIENFLAASTLQNPNNFGVLRPVTNPPAAASASPATAAAASPAASPKK